METVLFYTPGTCSLACMVALHWLDQPFRVCRVEKDARHAEPFLRINAHGQVPVLRVDRRNLTEVNAILLHVAERAPRSGMLPVEKTWERDVANQWLSHLASGFHASFWPYFSPQRYIADEAQHDAVRASAVIEIRRQLAALDAHLAQREFMLDSGRSLLDGYLHAMDRWANKLVDMPNDFPNVWRHQKIMAKDANVRFAAAIERGESATLENESFLGHVELESVLNDRAE
jgi:glutathione S-transferase